MFILFVGKLPGVPSDAMALGIGRSTVHHAEFRTDAAGQARFQEWAVPEVSASDISAFRAGWRRNIERVQMEPLNT
ncbi:MAG TPA: hypothetical protein VFE47_29355 [Tepidisphaeraceae bacterium]|nr:hypothetical protein [Tepidisphaeraceae bacterium]